MKTSVADPRCPAEVPVTPNEPCSTPGQVCAYPPPPATGGSATVIYCAAQAGMPMSWLSERPFRCDRVCQADQSQGVTRALSGGPPCETRPLSPCYSYFESTDQESLDKEVGGILAMCGFFTTNQLDVLFDRGCPTSMWLSRDDAKVPPGFLDCLADRLSSKRFACAVGLSCSQIVRTALR